MRYRLCIIGIIALIISSIAASAAPVFALDLSVRVINPATRNQISKNLWGVDFEGLRTTLPFPDMTQFLSPAYIDANSFAQLGVQMIRFPGGCYYDNYDALTTQRVYYQDTKTALPTTVNMPFYSIADAVQLKSLASPTADILYQININQNNLTNTNGCGYISQYKPSALGQTRLDEARAIVTQWSNSIKYYELGGDEWISWTPTEYSNNATAFARAMKLIDPTIKIGVIGYPSLAPINVAQRQAWETMIKNLMNDNSCNGPCFDFVTDRQYPRVLANPPANFAGAVAYYAAGDFAGNLRNFKNTNYFPYTIGMSELSLACDPEHNQPLSQFVQPGATTVEQGFFTITTLFGMAREQVTLANYHNLTVATACGLFAGAAQFSTTGQVFSLSSIAAGADLFDTTVEPVNAGFFTLPANTGCDPITTSPHCLIGASQIRVLSSYTIKQGDQMYIFLVNRFNPGTTEFVNLIVNFNPYPSYQNPTGWTLNVQALENINTMATTWNVQAPQTQTVTSPFQIALPNSSVVRLHIVDFFKNAPTPTPTSAAAPTLNHTIVQKLLNLKKDPVEPCTQDIIMYVIATAVYIMLIFFGIAFSSEVKLNAVTMIFFISGVIGYFVCSLQTGFIMGVMLSLILW